MARATNQHQSKQNKQQQRKGSATSAATARATSSGSSSAVEMLKQDHRKVEALFDQFESADDDQKERLVEQICSELIIHTRLEEEIFYPACREAGVESEKMDESQVEHDGAKMLINDLLEADSDTPYFEAKVSVLKEMIRHHVEEEEEPSEGVFAQAQEHDIDDSDLAQEITQRKQELQQRGIGRRPARPIAIGMGGASRGGMGGGRMGYDERFRGGNERGYGASRRYEENEYEGGYGRGGRRGGGSQGDWHEGRYGGGQQQGRRYEEDDRRFRSPYDDRDEDGRHSRGQPGWYGDPRGHSEASRRGWEERRHDDDDDRRNYRSRDEDDERPGGHGGWSGDSRGHAEAARRGWQHRR